MTAGTRKEKISDVSNIISLAQTVRRQGDPRKALALLRQAMDRYPDDVMLLSAYATTLIASKQIQVGFPSRASVDSYLARSACW